MDSQSPSGVCRSPSGVQPEYVEECKVLQMCVGAKSLYSCIRYASAPVIFQCVFAPIIFLQKISKCALCVRAPSVRLQLQSGLFSVAVAPNFGSVQLLVAVFCKYLKTNQRPVETGYNWSLITDHMIMFAMWLCLYSPTLFLKPTPSMTTNISDDTWPALHINTVTHHWLQHLSTKGYMPSMP
jgi:hypothetical protein